MILPCELLHASENAKIRGAFAFDRFLAGASVVRDQLLSVRLMKLLIKFNKYLPGSGMGWFLPGLIARSCCAYRCRILSQSSGNISLNFATTWASVGALGNAAATAASFSFFLRKTCLATVSPLVVKPCDGTF